MKKTIRFLIKNLCLEVYKFCKVSPGLPAEKNLNEVYKLAKNWFSKKTLDKVYRFTGFATLEKTS